MPSWRKAGRRVSRPGMKIRVFSGSMEARQTDYVAMRQCVRLAATRWRLYPRSAQRLNATGVDAILWLNGF